MNPSPQAIAAIRAKVQDWSPSDAAIAASLNAPSIANPATQATVLKPFTVGDLMAKVTANGAPDAVALGKIYGRAAVQRFADDCKAQDRGAVANWLQLAYIAGDVNQAQHDAMLAVVQATQPDPAYQAQISWAQANLGRPVDTADIAAARPGA